MKPNQTDQVARYLERNGEISPMQALNRLGIYRLAARIMELRDDGYPIETRRENGRTVYVLTEEPRYE